MIKAKSSGKDRLSIEFKSIEFKSFLTGRSQFSVVNSASSEPVDIKCGIPQGTVLGPLLFLLYINDISDSLKHSHIKLFADDSNLFIFNKNLKELFRIANSELSNLSHWISANKLYINYDKTNYMLFTGIKGKKDKSYHDDPNLPLLLGNHRLE